jgi:hypothetical protein
MTADAAAREGGVVLRVGDRLRNNRQTDPQAFDYILRVSVVDDPWRCGTWRVMCRPDGGGRARYVNRDRIHFADKPRRSDYTLLPREA